ncbi:MAG: phospholipase D-like domain-containing protein [Actinobacteria bacterium]|nr:phospholipase D-like domain-containing protein [Actinomycetota bacterium]
MQGTHSRVTVGRRILVTLGALGLLGALAVPPASAADFTIDPKTGEAAQVGDITNPTKKVPASCPTFTSEPRAIEAWFNTDDMDYRGYMDPKNQRPWSFANKTAQVICGAAKGSTIQIGMYFIRAIGTEERPETDSQMVWNALRYVNKKRGVKIEMVLDGGGITSAAGKASIRKELSDIVNIKWCYNGCFNVNKSSKFPWAINHEKFVAISKTNWGTKSKDANVADGGPAVYSSSGQFARSQVRTYWQEATLFYGDRELFNQFNARFEMMQLCTGKSTGGKNCTKSKLKAAAKAAKTTFTLKKERGIWVDKTYRHYTDAGRGTTVSFSPQDNFVTDYYTSQMGNVDCKVDNKIRIAMYRLTETRSAKFIEVIGKLKKKGCDVQVLLSQTGGAQTISKVVSKAIKTAKLGKQVRCTATPIHTKLILIGPADNNTGRVMMGTANMTTSGLRYSEEHVITMDSRRITKADVAEDFRHAYGVYLAGWNELNQGSKACK